MSSADNFCRSGSKLFDTLIVFLKQLFEKVDFEKISKQKSMINYPECIELKCHVEFAADDMLCSNGVLD